MIETTNGACVLPVCIVGYGTAGVNAAIALRGAGYEGEIHAFSDTEIAPYSPILTSYYAGGEKTYAECFPWGDEDLAELGVTVHAGARVVGLDPAAHLVRTGAGEEFSYRKCVVAVGARPQTSGFPAVDGYDPLVLRTMGDAERMKAAFSAPACRRVLVSGASMVALKSVEAALRCGCEVSLVGMNDHVLDYSASPETAARFERGLADQGVAMRFGQAIADVRLLGEGAEGGRLEVRYSGGGVGRYDEIVVAHGVRPDLSFVAEGSLDTDCALIVDEFMRTSDPDVYAAGDCAQALELVSGEKRVLGIWRTAALQGAAAGTAIAAELAGRAPAAEAAYRGAIATNTIAVNGTLFISAGDSLAAEGDRVEVREDDAMTLACIWRPDAAEASGERLVGFSLACDTDEPGGVAYDIGAMLSLRIEEGCQEGCRI